MSIMKHKYTVTGMTCNGCRAHVEKELNAVEGVENASVDLENKEAIIEMKNHIPLKIFQEASQGTSYEILNHG